MCRPFRFITIDILINFMKWLRVFRLIDSIFKPQFIIFFLHLIFTGNIPLPLNGFEMKKCNTLTGHGLLDLWSYIPGWGRVHPQKSTMGWSRFRFPCNQIVYSFLDMNRTHAHKSLVVSDYFTYFCAIASL